MKKLSVTTIVGLMVLLFGSMVFLLSIEACENDDSTKKNEHIDKRADSINTSKP